MEFKCMNKKDDGTCSLCINRKIKCECLPGSGCSELEWQYNFWLPTQDKEDL
jgi:hypothetical protein